ncbi:hypothetical protein ILUMI_17595 [Ignelater luminosus]|uniref:Uncharacterized protein n=1 Tax=Ignelater luminosus TaxID=2038154 RepID=A0A8K0CJK9_IGNLU|nr:hypothetical protein ILUMI_17595 [Ignelater luminosus]
MTQQNKSSVNVSTGALHLMTSMALIGSIENFNPHKDNWILYQEQLEQFFTANAISPGTNGQLDKRVAALLGLIGADTYKVLRDLCTLNLYKTKTYDSLCSLLKTHFSPTICAFGERIDFYEAKHQDEESVSSWYAGIHNLLTNCEFGITLNVIVADKFICGMKSGRVRDRLCEEESTTSLEKLLEIALNKESSMQAEIKDIYVMKHKNLHQARKNNHRKPESSHHVTQSDQTEGRWKCKCCGNLHTGMQICKYVKYVCNKCQLTGHLLKVCLKMKSNIL